MSDELEKRREADRRRRPRGGRRTGDIDGLAPLVLLVGAGQRVVEEADAILAKLKFAVGTSPNVQDALRALPELRPEVIVASERDAEAIRTAQNAPIVIERRAAAEPAEKMAERILQALRSSAVY